VYRLSKFLNGQLQWSIENVGMDILVRDIACIMEEMSHDGRVSLSLVYV
jgi:hypothetical protein